MIVLCCLAHKCLRWCLFNYPSSKNSEQAQNETKEWANGRRIMWTYSWIGWILEWFWRAFGWGWEGVLALFLLAVFLLFLVSAELPQSYLGFSLLVEGRAHQV